MSAAVRSAQEAVDAANGELYCATEDLLDARWERYTRDDFIQLILDVIGRTSHNDCRSMVNYSKSI